MIEQEFIGLGVLFFFVIIGALIAHKFKQPIGIGLLLIGALIGPHALNLIKNEATLDILMEIGTALLLFIIGLEFIIPKIVKTGIKAMILGVLKIGIIFFICYELLIVTGIDPMVALIIGLILTISSTVVIVKVLEAKGMYNREHCFSF
jgi:CPA2 family monovalent cation:H+ antiporter-2